jgi:poly(3-hydroxybutyrate) depolymerase
MREDIQFNVEGETLRGWLYRPEGGPRQVPIVVMAHGWGR